MNYEDKYKSALERAKKLYKDAITLQLEQDIKDYEYIFPELKESEDERIRKELLESFKYQQRESRTDKEWLNGIKLSEVIAWLEKQKSVGEIVERCKDSWYNEGKIAGMAEGLTDDEKYQQGWHDALEKQGEQKPILNVPSREVILAIWDLGNEWKELTNGSISTKYGTTLDYIQKHWHESEYYLREKQDEKKPIFNADDWYVSNVDGKIHDMTYNPTNKVEPKFKNGQWIVWQDKYYKVNDNGCGYELIDQNGLKTSLEYSTVDENAHIFTTQDAKDGDVLYSLDSKQPFIFKHRKTNEQAAVYCGINTYGKFFIWNTKDCVITTDKYIPADKSQRDILFKEMQEAGYQWDAEKKELKLLISNGGDFESNNSKQKPTWSEEDEEILKNLIDYFSLDDGLRLPCEETIDWLKSLKERLS